jgi:selenocysteine lyase/cysteine desulfurase
MTLAELQKQVVGLNEAVPLLDGSQAVYVNFDNGASTPALRPVMEKVDEFLKWYSNVHRGTGFKSQLSSHVFDTARDITAEFVHADDCCSVLFCKNTTEAINKLAARFHCPGAGEEKPIILTTIMEHHSNELPWRRVGTVIHVEMNDDGTVDLDDLNDKLDQYRNKIQLVAVTAASNVTGYINPVHDIARWVHDAGAQIAVDAAQVAAHRPIDVRPCHDPEHIDYLAFSAHKMYAPYGIGVLVADKKMFEFGEPEYVGGGTVDIVNLESAYWKDLPEREEAGTPDIVGVVALAKTILLLQEVGFDSIVKHEAELTAYTLKKLGEMSDIVIYGDKNPETAAERLGVIAFNVKDMHHALVAAILSYEGGIGARNGCFCAHPYVKRLLGVSRHDAQVIETMIRARDRSTLPGAVRVSFGLYNTKDEIDRLCDILKMVVNKSYKGTYRLNKERGEYHPVDYRGDFSAFFRL